MSSLRAFKSIDRSNCSMFEDAAMEELGYSPFEETLGGTNPSSSSNKREKTRGGKSNRIRRFSDNQTRSLERIFESETRLEPQKKVEVARELGLQPRQVAIWFQNKRARWKSKRLEHECAMLRADYTHLASRLESLKNEKCALISQLEKLKVLAGKAGAAATTSTDGDVQSGEEDETVQLKMDPPPPPVAAAAATPTPSLSDDESGIGAAAWFLGISEETDRDWDRRHHHHRQEESQSLMISMDMVDRGSSLTSTCHGPSLGLDSDDLLDPGSPDQWWDFWS